MHLKARPAATSLLMFFGLAVVFLSPALRVEAAGSSYEILQWHWDLAGGGDHATAVCRAHIRINSSEGITDYVSSVAIHEGPYAKVNRDSIRVEQIRKGRRLPTRGRDKTSRYSVHNLPSAGVTYSEDKTLILLPLERPQVGDELQFEWVVEYSSTLGWPRLIFQEDVPVADYHYGVRLIPGEKLKYFANGTPGPEPTVTSRENGTTQYSFDARNVPAFVALPGSVSTVRSRPHWTLQTTLWAMGKDTIQAESWGDVGKAYFNYIREQIQPDQKVTALADKLMAGSDGPDDYTRKAFEYVRDQIRYSAVYLGEGGYYPVKCSVVDTDKKGDCKGMSVLLYSLLRQKDIPAGLALVMTRNRGVVDPAVPAMRQFNHMIAWAETSDGERVFMDPTSKSAPFGLLPNGDRMNHSLVIDHQGKGELVAMPLEAPESTTNTLQGEVRPNDQGGYHVRLRYRFSGYSAASLIYGIDLLKKEEKDAALRRWGMNIFPGAEITQARGNTLDKNQEYVVTVEMNVEADLVVTSRGRLRLFPAARLDKPVKPRTEGSTQVHGLGHPSVELETWTFQVPKQAWDLPEAAKSTGPGQFAEAEMTVQVDDAGVITSSLKQTFKGGEVNPGQVQQYRKETRAVYRLANAVAKPPKP